MNDFSTANYEFFYACWAIPPAMETLPFQVCTKNGLRVKITSSRSPTYNLIRKLIRLALSLNRKRLMHQYIR